MPSFWLAHQEASSCWSKWHISSMPWPIKHGQPPKALYSHLVDCSSPLRFLVFLGLIWFDGSFHITTENQSFARDDAIQVISGIRDIEECKAICAAQMGDPCYDAEFGGCEPKCSGIEFSLGRCELWHVEIESVNPNVNGYTCLKFDMST